jgi:hypothetical protein
MEAPVGLLNDLTGGGLLAKLPVTGSEILLLRRRVNGRDVIRDSPIPIRISPSRDLLFGPCISLRAWFRV